MATTVGKLIYLFGVLAMIVLYQALWTTITKPVDFQPFKAFLFFGNNKTILPSAQTNKQTVALSKKNETLPLVAVVACVTAKGT